MFTEKNYGNPISEKLSEAFRRNVSANDYANAAVRGGCSPSLVKQLVLRNTTITDNNSKAVEVLLEIAKENCERTIAQAKVDKKYFESLK